MINDERTAADTLDPSSASTAALTVDFGARTGTRYATPKGRRTPNFIMLWTIVSGLWTVATGLRMQRAWVPGTGWHALLSSPFTWINLALPPLLFALVLIALRRVADGSASRGVNSTARNSNPHDTGADRR